MDAFALFLGIRRSPDGGAAKNSVVESGLVILAKYRAAGDNNNKKKQRRKTMKGSKTRRRVKQAAGYNPDPNDDKIMREKSEELFRKYPGQYVVVCGGEIFVGRDAAALDREARRKHPGITPHGCPIPRPKDLICVL